jgi:hypothetical protein
MGTIRFEVPSGVRVPTRATTGLAKLGMRRASAERITGAHRVSPAGSKSALGLGTAKPDGGGGSAAASAGECLATSADLGAGASTSPTAAPHTTTAAHSSTPGREITRRTAVIYPVKPGLCLELMTGPRSTTKWVELTISTTLASGSGSSNAVLAGTIPASLLNQAACRASTEWIATAAARNSGAWSLGSCSL